MSYIRAISGVVGSRFDVVTLRDQMVRWVARFSCGFFTAMAGNNWQRRRTRALLCPFMLWVNGKGVLFWVENFFKFALWMNNICSRLLYALELLRLFCSIELICEFPKQCLYNHNQNLFLIVSYCLCSFGEFLKVFERQVWHLRVVHLHSAASALPNPSRCFQIVNKFWQRFVSLSFCAEMLQQF